MNEELKVLKKNLQRHQGHRLEYTELNGIGRLSCTTCQYHVDLWPLASLEPDYELHQAVDSIQAKIDEHFGEEWVSVVFDFNSLEARIEEFWVFDTADEDISLEAIEEYHDILMELEEAGDFILLMHLNIREFTRGVYPNVPTD